MPRCRGTASRAGPDQMSTYEMDGFSSLANLFILNTSKLYRCMQHTSLPTVCGTNTRVCSSLFILFFLIRLGLQNVHAVQDRSRDMLAPLDCMKEWLAFVVFNLFFLYREDLWTKLWSKHNPHFYCHI